MKHAPRHGDVYDGATNDHVVRVGKDETAHLPVGTYRLAIDPDIVMENIEVGPGEEVVLEIGG